ncbi:MAG: endonuclease/exonuclease/phosphatase family protein [Aureliella sp.]
MARRGRRSSSGRIPVYPIMVLFLAGFGGYLGCDSDSLSNPDDAWVSVSGDRSNAADSSSVTVPVSRTQPTWGGGDGGTLPKRTIETLTMGSFNLHTFGKTKLTKPWVLERYADIVRQFDVIAVQEIRSKDQTTLPRLMAIINQGGGAYDYTISERIGRASIGYYEQYAFIFDTNRVRTTPEQCYVVNDDADLMHREPFVGRFQTVAPNPFRFTLINVHTDPDEIEYELDVLADVYRSVREYEYPEDDVILLGDLNEEPGKLRNLELIPYFLPLVQTQKTNTRGSKTIDNILIDQQTTVEFSGRAGVIDFVSAFGISQKEALSISDHLPVWAEFSMTERAPRTAASPFGRVPGR